MDVAHTLTVPLSSFTHPDHTPLPSPHPSIPLTLPLDSWLASPQVVHDGHQEAQSLPRPRRRPDHHVPPRHGRRDGRRLHRRGRHKTRRPHMRAQSGADAQCLPGPLLCATLAVLCFAITAAARVGQLPCPGPRPRLHPGLVTVPPPRPRWPGRPRLRHGTRGGRIGHSERTTRVSVDLRQSQGQAKRKGGRSAVYILTSTFINHTSAALTPDTPRLLTETPPRPRRPPAPLPHPTETKTATRTAQPPAPACYALPRPRSSCAAGLYRTLSRSSRTSLRPRKTPTLTLHRTQGRAACHPGPGEPPLPGRGSRRAPLRPRRGGATK